MIEKCGVTPACRKWSAYFQKGHRQPAGIRRQADAQRPGRYCHQSSLGYSLILEVTSMNRRVVSRRTFIKQSAVSAGSACVGLTGLKGRVQQAAGSRQEVPAGNLVLELQKLVPSLMTKFGVPGLSIALIQGAKILWHQGFGVRDITTKEPVTRDTVYEAASLSKPAFAYAALKMVEKGMLGLDDPLDRFLPQPFMPNEPRLKLITARMVLSHTSGLPAARSRGKPLVLVSDPGKGFHYSPTGFDYLQSVVRLVSGQPLADFMRTNVIEPFGLVNSSFGWDDKYDARIAQAYDKRGAPGQTFNERYRRASEEWRNALAKDFPELSYPSAAAGLYSTAGDFARFMIEIIAPSKKDAWHLSESSLNEMLKPQSRVDGAVSWGLGWGLQHTRSGDAFWHWGNWAGLYQHFAMALRDERKGVVIMTNSGNGLKLCKQLAPVAIGVDIKPLSGFLN